MKNFRLKKRSPESPIRQPQPINRVFKVGVLALILAALISTKPQGKEQYVQAVSQLAHESWCRQPEDELCEMVSPITRPTLNLALKAWTRTEDYVLFTFFHTPLPCLDVFGIGVAGQQIIWPVPDKETKVCSF